MPSAAIKSANEQLTEEQRTALTNWLVILDQAKWDNQICEDFSPGGRGTKLLEEADAAIDRGDFKPLG